MHPVLIDWRGVRIHSYTAMLYLGANCGLITSNYFANLAGLNSLRVLLAMLALLAVGLVGARLLHILLHAGFYRRHSEQIWRRSQGGAAQLGGLLLMLAVSAPLLDALELPRLRFWDVGAIGLLVGLAITKTGCLLNGCCGGRPSRSRIAVSLPDHRGHRQKRLPSQLLESGAAALIVWVAIGLWSADPFPGAVFFTSAFLYAVARLALQTTRDVQDVIRGVNVQLALAAALAAAALAGLIATGSP